MAMVEITNLLATMTNPTLMFKAMDVTGLWIDALLWGMLVIVIFATAKWYERLSHRFAVASFTVFVIGAILYSVDWASVVTFYRLIVILVASIIYLYADKTLQDQAG